MDDAMHDSGIMYRLPRRSIANLSIAVWTPKPTAIVIM